MLYELRARACVEEACEFRPMSRAKCCVQWSNFVEKAELGLFTKNPLKKVNSDNATDITCELVRARDPRLRTFY